MATKALATLLVDRRDLAAALIGEFADVDDAYVVDRVLAAAYGAATRRSSDEGLAELAQAAFGAVFARDALTPHSLIRDHARGLIELAATRGVLPDDVPLDRARPPYPRGMPLERVSEETISSYIQDHGGGSFHDQICSSAVRDGDFARYEIDPLAGHFLRLPRDEYGRSMREIYIAWHAAVVAQRPDRETAFARVLEVAEQIHRMPHDFERWDRRGSTERIDERRAAERELENAIGEFESMLDENAVEEFRIRARGYLRGRMWDERAAAWHPTYVGKATRYWVAWRAHELGWTPERFADFERGVASRSRTEHRVERIGKKYQWIAHHELTGRLSDVALVEGAFRGEPELYRGPWQVGTREMDPTILVTRTKQRDSDRQGATWWSPHFSRWRSDSPEARIAWMEDRSRDIPDPVRQIDVADPSGRRWLVLETNVGRNHWVMVDGERMIHRMTWHKIKSMLVAREDVWRLERMLTRSAADRDHPPGVELPYATYLGEYPWHPAFASVDGVLEVGATSAISVRATTANWYVERAGHNYSIEESFNLTIPAPALMRGLDLRLAEGRSLAYATVDGRVLFKDPSANEPGFSAAVVDRDAMLAFLDDQELEIVWVVSGEKSAHGGRPHGNGWGGALEYWGVYRFNNAGIHGMLNLERKDARPEQIEEFLANP